MPKINLVVLTLIIFVALTGSANALSGDSLAVDRNYALLRGTWRFVDFHQTSIIMFESDSRMDIEHQTYSYALAPGSIYLYNGKDSSRFSLRLDGNNLVSNVPDGREKTFSKISGGKEEHLVEGNFIYSDTSGKSIMITFDGENQFHAFAGTDDRLDGLYRVEDGMIYLSLDDSSIDEAEIHSFDSDGSVRTIAYNGNIYESDMPARIESSGQPDILVCAPMGSPPLPPPDPIPFPAPVPDPQPVPPLPPAYTVTPPSGAKSDNAGNAETSKSGRDFGTTRGTKPPR